jgi:soluble lytic murein transglycosylase
MTIETCGLPRLLASVAIVALWAVPAFADPQTPPAMPPDRPLGYAPVDGTSSLDPADPLKLLVRPLAVDMAALRDAIQAYRKGDVARGDALQATFRDPAAIRLCEWLAVRGPAFVGFDRIAAFLSASPDWPGVASLRRRAEEALLAERRAPGTVLAFFAGEAPLSTSGRVALAQAYEATGRRSDAVDLVRRVWREDTFGEAFEKRLISSHGAVITAADHRFRMERFLFRDNWTSALRAATYAGTDHATLVRARQAVERKARNAQALLDAVPPRLREDSSYQFSRAQHLRRQNKFVEAAKIHAAMPRDATALVDGDAWWTERRVLARELLDVGDAATAYEVVRRHAAEREADKIEAEWHAGWIALRFLNAPLLASWHFAAAAGLAETPISTARAAYWQGRAAEAVHGLDAARPDYERAAEHSITYYGQLARVKLGLTNLPLRNADAEAGRSTIEALSVTPVIRLLKAADAADLALPLYADLGRSLNDPAQLAALGDLASEKKDARAVLALGKSAIHRGLPLDHHAYPTIGIPQFETVGEPVEKAMVHAIARQESAFHAAAVSHAGARGLMQLMPATARRTAQRYKVAFDLGALTSNPSYNAKLGSAHLGELLEDYKGSVVLTFAAYNAGGGNVKKWLNAYGDPRKPEVDAVDWIERIPFTETRNYVQRVMENLQVYRHRMGDRTAFALERELRERGRDLPAASATP